MTLTSIRQRAARESRARGWPNPTPYRATLLVRARCPALVDAYPRTRVGTASHVRRIDIASRSERARYAWQSAEHQAHL
jgi:hypothetical protein